MAHAELRDSPDMSVGTEGFSVSVTAASTGIAPRRRAVPGCAARRRHPVDAVNQAVEPDRLRFDAGIGESGCVGLRLVARHLVLGRQHQRRRKPGERPAFAGAASGLGRVGG